MNPSPNTLPVLVAGGGIGGLAAALALGVFLQFLQELCPLSLPTDGISSYHTLSSHSTYSGLPLTLPNHPLGMPSLGPITLMPHPWGQQEAKFLFTASRHSAAPGTSMHMKGTTLAPP